MSRVKPQSTVEEIKEYVQEIAGVDADVMKIQSRNTHYSSFLIPVDKNVEDRVLDPDEWQEGLIIRPFPGFLRRTYDETREPTSENATVPVVENTLTSANTITAAAAAAAAIPAAPAAAIPTPAAATSATTPVDGGEAESRTVVDDIVGE